jgi:hypothetical protein
MRSEPSVIVADSASFESDSQFANTDANFTSPTLGLISSSTAVDGRVGHLGLKLNF